jgi:hypothetical protein
MPKYVHVLVEGPTEDAFVKKILNPYLNQKEIYLTPVIIRTKDVIQGPDYKGGISSYKQIKQHLELLLKDTSINLLTTMIDYYALPSDFPGYNGRPETTCYQRVEYLEKEFFAEINNTKFLPYLQLHEFEALVFAGKENIAAAFPNAKGKTGLVSAISDSFNSPEEINENYDTAPSRRLKAIFPEYQKVFHSQLILSGINVESLRSKCLHFDSWLSKLEN